MSRTVEQIIIGILEIRKMSLNPIDILSSDVWHFKIFVQKVTNKLCCAFITFGFLWLNLFCIFIFILSPVSISSAQVLCLMFFYMFRFICKLWHYFLTALFLNLSVFTISLFLLSLSLSVCEKKIFDWEDWGESILALWVPNQLTAKMMEDRKKW